MDARPLSPQQHVIVVGTQRLPAPHCCCWSENTSASMARITPYPTQAERQLAAELERQAATEGERERLRADLLRQESERKNASQRKRALAAKLKGMENKLLKGGQLLDKAATQEAELRTAKQELTRKQECERRMANEMREPVWKSTSE